MTTLPPSQPHPIWRHYVAPTARALEAFFWKLVFVTIVVCVFSGVNPLKPKVNEVQPVANHGSADGSRLAVAASGR